MVTDEKPGCYGLPVAVSALSSSCRVCPFRASCSGEAFSFLESLPDNPITRIERQSLSLTRKALTSTPSHFHPSEPQPRVVASSRGLKRALLGEAMLDEISRLPPRVVSQVKRLAENGWFDHAKSELRLRRNPADKGWRKIFCNHLLAGGCDRSELESSLVSEAGLSATSARVQTSVGLSIFAAGRVATVQFGRFIVSPN